MKKALRLMSYANHPPHTPVLQVNRRVRKGNQQLRSWINLLIEIRLNGESGTERTKSRGKEGRGCAELIPLAMV